ATVGRKMPSFEAYRDFPAPGASVPAQSDLNGDGVMDLVISNLGSHNISVLLGNPDGTFQAPIAVKAGAFSSDVAVADLNGDGVMDIAAATSAGVSVILGEGSGSFGPPTIMPAGQGPNRIITSDLNGDHVADLVAINFDSNDVSVFI